MQHSKQIKNTIHQWPNLFPRLSCPAGVSILRALLLLQRRRRLEVGSRLHRCLNVIHPFKQLVDPVSKVAVKPVKHGLHLGENRIDVVTLVILPRTSLGGRLCEPSINNT